MTYSKTTWVDEVLAGAERFDIKDTGGTTIHGDTQIVLKTSVSVPGTSINATNLNKIEQGISDATVPINRQGGSATNWSTNGVSNYTPAAGAWRVQAGSSITGQADYGETDITFPVAFAYPPTVIVTNASANYYAAIVYDITASQFTVKCIGFADDLCHTGAIFNWIAIGPA